MKGLYNRKKPPGAGLGCPLEKPSTVPGAPVPCVTACKRAGPNKGTRSLSNGGEKVYVGVRVRMPVKDLLKNIRVTHGVEPDDFNEPGSKKGSGNLKRARTRARSKATRVRGKQPVKSLEELATLIEVLEEDLRTSSSTYSPYLNPAPCEFLAYPDRSPTDGGDGDEYDDIIPSPESYVSYSLCTSEHQGAWARPDCMFSCLRPCTVSNIQTYGENEDYLFTLKNNWDLSSSGFFWAQLQKEEGWLMATSDAELLATDEHGRTLLHKVVCMGKRTQAYTIARRMAVINRLDLKDSDGMTALLYAAKHNQHVMVADLIRLGADVNEKNNLGKSCLHLSAEKGYFRVLEVLKQGIMDGLYVDVEATDNSGMSVLQCVSVALRSSMSKMENSMPLSQSRLHALHQKHMMETLKCVLQMDSYLHVAASWSVTGKGKLYGAHQPHALSVLGQRCLNSEILQRETGSVQPLSGEPEYKEQSWWNSQQICPAGHFGNPTVMF